MKVTLESLDRRLRELEAQVAALFPSTYPLNQLLVELDRRIEDARAAGDLERYRQLRAIRDKHR